MSLFSHSALAQFVSEYGYGAIAVLVGMETMAIPVPGETVLVAAAVAAASSHMLSIWGVIAAGAAGAIIGDNVAYLIGSKIGFWLLTRFGRYVWITEARIKLGQYLFLKHGGRIVFFGRFVPLLRELSPYLAGANGMGWRTFLAYNAAGGIAWVTFDGLIAYFLGKQASSLATPFEIGGAVFFFALFLVPLAIVRRNEERLERRAERRLPGPVHPLNLEQER